MWSTLRSMETVQQNACFTLFSSKFHSDIYSILFGSRFFKILSALKKSHRPWNRIFHFWIFFLTFIHCFSWYHLPGLHNVIIKAKSYKHTILKYGRKVVKLWGLFEKPWMLKKCPKKRFQFHNIYNIVNINF